MRAKFTTKRSRGVVSARYPLGPWPMQMRADMVAAYLDYRDTAELAAAIRRGEAPPPTSFRRRGRRREPVWSRVTLDCYTSRRTVCESTGVTEEDLQSLV